MKTSTILRKAKHLIRTPDRWIQGAMRRTVNNGKKCYCAVGAMRATKTINTKNNYIKGFRLLKKFIPKKNSTLFTYNDEPKRTHAQMMELFDRAIEKAKKEEAK